MSELIAAYWLWLIDAFLVTIDIWATVHIVLAKRDNRAALGWIGIVWFTPFLGAVLYLIFGINRIQRKARRLRRRTGGLPKPLQVTAESIPQIRGMEEMQRLIQEVTGRSLSLGNRVRTLVSGEIAYQEILTEIAAAEHTIGLSTYIFANDQTGRAFTKALAAAVGRGVSVRVLIDGIGSRYSFPSIVGPLRAAGVPVARFLPSIWPWLFPYAQLRNHHKIIIIDGRVGFTGGMNLCDGHDLRAKPRFPITDCHFRIDGPAVFAMRAVFSDDWQLATGERLSGTGWFPDLNSAGNCVARGIESGPDDNVETLRLTYLGAIACARRSLRIVTPYFVPDSDVISGLCVAALRGIEVDIIVPERNNLQLVHWAMMGQLAPLLECGCRVWLNPPPFDHTKILLVDEGWSLIGSANWDARSLRLNFEFDIECYDADLSGELTALVQQKLAQSRPLTAADLKQRTLFCKLRDGVARLMSPYL